MWILRCYDPSGGSGGIHSWYHPLHGKVKAAIDAALELLAYEPGPLNGLAHYRALRGVCQGLDEVIIDLDDGRNFRILSFQGPGRRECTLLLGFEKKNNLIYGPKCSAAQWRKKGVERNGQRAPECQFP